MANEGLEEEEWDDDFLEKLVQAEEQILSTQLSVHHYPPPPPSPPPPIDVSYSPPRELSQRPKNSSEKVDCFESFAPPVKSFAKEQEIDRLKNELGRVSKQLNLLEKECSELRKEKDKKEEQLKVIHPRIEAKDVEFDHAKSTDSARVVSCPTDPGISRAYENVNSSDKPFGSWTKCRASAYITVGVQTDKVTEFSCRGSEKLFGLWNSSDRNLGKSLVEKLFMICEKDFHVLFGYLNSSFPCQATTQSVTDMALSDQLHPTQPIETIKVSQLYTVLMKISNETSSLKDLLEALFDLCSLKNVVIVHRSLHVVHMVLMNSFSMENKFDKRENVMVEEPSFSNSEVNGCGYSGNGTLLFAKLTEILNQGDMSNGLRLPNVNTPRLSGFFDRRFVASISIAYWVSLFEHMCQIAITHNVEEIRHEALSVMNLILMRQNAYLERDKFVGELLFRSLSQLLRREAGFCAQDLAVHVLYLLCSCPKVIAMFCLGFKEDLEHASYNDASEKRVLTSQELNDILTALADCVACRGSATPEEMKLRRNAILFLAFLGSSGKSGMEILLNYRLPKGTNFLTIIIQSLISDLDLEILKPVQLPDVVREQSLLIREALILLNRLVSHPQYSVPVLQALTNTRDIAGMTVDLANRLTHASKFLWQEDKTSRQVRESEIMDLARVFKKRVFTFLGDSIT